MCGQSVEWLRSCYQSEWSLFHDTGVSTPIRGRYYFSPVGTPFYAGMHNLWSAAWLDTNVKYIQGRGEIIDTARTWDVGFPPAILPSNDTVGEQSCIADGEQFAQRATGDDVIDGFPINCFSRMPAQLLAWERASDFQSCALQFAYARVIEWLYTAEVDAITDFLTEVLGDGYTFQFHQGRPLVPNVFTAMSEFGGLAWIDGTATYQQFAMQAAYTVSNPTDFGGFSTSPFWYDGSTFVLDCLRSAGMNDQRPIFFCGHSYGGVCAALCAARLRLVFPNQQIRWLTYGAPKAGDIRLTSLVGRCPGMSMGNDTDIVVSVPPNLTELLPSVLELNVPRFLVWPNWKDLPYPQMMLENGRLIPGESAPLTTAIINVLIDEILLGHIFPPVAGHSITLYKTRIRARCPEPEYPLNTAEYAMLEAVYGLLLEDGGNILLESGDRILLEGA